MDASSLGPRVGIRVVHRGRAAEEIVHDVVNAARGSGAVSEPDGDGLIVVELREGSADEVAQHLRELALLRNDYADELVEIAPLPDAGR
jgi:hypothetical protein